MIFDDRALGFLLVRLTDVFWLSEALVKSRKNDRIRHNFTRTTCFCDFDTDLEIGFARHVFADCAEAARGIVVFFSRRPRCSYGVSLSVIVAIARALRLESKLRWAKPNGLTGRLCTIRPRGTAAPDVPGTQRIERSSQGRIGLPAGSGRSSATRNRRSSSATK